MCSRIGVFILIAPAKGLKVSCCPYTCTLQHCHSQQAVYEAVNSYIILYDKGKRAQFVGLKMRI